MTMLIAPGWLLLGGACLIPFIPKGAARTSFMLALPLFGMGLLWLIPDGSLAASFGGYAITPFRMDGLARIFCLIFLIATFLSALYAWHIRDTFQHVSAFIYAGAALSALTAGDLLTLFVFWELVSLGSVGLIWARRGEGAWHTGLRYLIWQMASGLLLLGGALFFFRETGSLAFDAMTLQSPSAWLIFLAFGIKAGFPLLHNWIQDAYPAGTITGTVFLSCFTTKLAIYALARGFPGMEALIYIGVIMTIFPIFYAVIENDLRRVLSYSLNNQLGFMVVGIGIGTPLAINGAVAHAFCHIIYKSLLFMSVGAVMYRVGTAKATELGGLYRSMPLTMIFCVIAAASISAFPLFSGFISKSPILSESLGGGYWVVWFLLLFASAGVFHHSGIKIPYFTFFAHDSGKRVREAPMHMLLAMGLAAFLCVAIGVYPQALYAMLPFPMGDYTAYDAAHVIGQLELLIFSALAFGFLMLSGLYPPEVRGVNLDWDWVYRRVLRRAFERIGGSVLVLGDKVWGYVLGVFVVVYGVLARFYGPGGLMGPSRAAGSMALWTAILLSLALLFAYA